MGPTPDNGLDQETNPWGLPELNLKATFLSSHWPASCSLKGCPPPLPTHTLGCDTGQDIPQVNR